MSKAKVEKEGDPEIDGRIQKMRTKIITEDLIRLEVEKRRKEMRKMM
jgi:flagellar biosynthesis protein FlhB